MNNLPRIAITGGIGSGKSYVCKLLADRGVKVYDCDAAAKLAKFLLASEANKQAVNDVVHPAVAADFIASNYKWLESAILFDAKFNERINFDYIVCVIAPEDVRIERIAKRDGISHEQALQWIKRQMPQEEMAQKSNFIIINDGTSDLSAAIMSLLEAVSTLGYKN